FSHTYAEELTGATFSVSVTDHNTTAAASTSTFNVDRTSVAEGALTPPVATEGAAFGPVVLFHFTDADSAGTATDYTATVTWGDGVVETSTANPTSVFVVASSGGGFDVKGTHSYAEELTGATFSVSVSDHNATAAASTSTFN